MLKIDIAKHLILLEFNNCLINDNNSTLITKMSRETLWDENDNDKGFSFFMLHFCNVRMYLSVYFFLSQHCIDGYKKTFV